MIIVRPLIPPFIPMGMDKSGSFSIGANTTVKVTGWVERSGFPGSIIQDNELVVNGEGNITVFLQGIRSSWAHTSDQFYIYKNGVQVAATGNIGFNSNASTQWTGNVVAGDSLAFYYKNGSINPGQALTGGYLYYQINP